MQYPQFGGSIVAGYVDITAANTATDGSGTINVIVTGAGKYADVTFANATEIVTCTNWDSVSSLNTGIVKNGDIVTIMNTGGIPTGLATGTDYIIGNLSVASNTATFKLYNASTLALVTFTTDGTTPHLMRFPMGTIIDEVVFINSQATAAASSPNVYKLFYSPRNTSVWFPLREIAAVALTRSTSVIGQRQAFVQTGGFKLPEGARLGATIATYAGAQDRTTAYAIQAVNL